MGRSKPSDKRLLIAINMPPLRRTQPNEDYCFEKDEVLNWISKRPGLMMYVFDKLVASKKIVYDSSTGKWQGIDYDD